MSLSKTTKKARQLVKEGKTKTIVCKTCNQRRKLEFFIKDSQTQTGYGLECIRCKAPEEVKKEKVFKLPGRKEIYSEEIVNKLSEILKIDGTVGEACSYAGISRDTYYNWLKNKAGFSDKMDDSKEYCFLLARKKLVSDIKNTETDAKSSIEFLRRRDKRYKDKVENEVSGQITNINFEFKEAYHSEIDENGEETK